MAVCNPIEKIEIAERMTNAFIRSADSAPEGLLRSERPILDDSKVFIRRSPPIQSYKAVQLGRVVHQDAPAGGVVCGPVQQQIEQIGIVRRVFLC